MSHSIEPPEEPQESSPNSLDFIAEQVQSYHKALREEFALIKSDDLKGMKDKVQERFSTKILSFVDTIIELSESSESESTRLTAAKFGLQFVLGDVHDDPKDDPLNKLIEGLMKKEKKSKKTQLPADD